MFLSDSDMGVVGLSFQSCRIAEAYLNRKALKLNIEGLSLRIYYWGVSPDHFDNPVHKHSFFEVCYLLDGEGSYLDDGTVYPLQKGCLFLSRPGVVHQIRSESGLFLLYVAFEVDSKESGEPWKAAFRKLEKAASVVLENAGETIAALIWRALLLQAEADDPMLEESVRQLAGSLLVSLADAFGGREEGESKRPVARPSSELLYRAQLFIRDNLSEPLPLEQVAEYLHVSARHLSRVFSGGMGVTFTEYVRAERISQACSLLRADEVSIKQVAAETGFGSVHYFSRVFTEAVGMTPGRYRRLHSGS